MGLEHFQKITQNGRTGPISLKRAASRLSESNDESQDVPRLRLAWRSLERRSQTTGSGQISLERREFRLSDANDES